MRKYRAVAVLGQSNERGRIALDANGAAGWPQVSDWGPPVNDPIPPCLTCTDGNGTGNYGSWWPRFAQIMAREHDVWLRMFNTAYGGSCIHEGVDAAHSWIGRVNNGTFDKDAGIPDATTNNNNERLSYIKSNLDSLPPLWDKWVYVSLGQADASGSTWYAAQTTDSDWKDALTCAVNWCRNQGYKVALGFTSQLDSRQAWMDDVGSAGVAQVLSDFSADSGVIAGADLNTALFNKVSFYDGTHLDKASMDLCGRTIADTLALNGFV